MVNINMKTKIYAGVIKDQTILSNSSSGGAFTALSDTFLQNGGAVACAVYNYSNHKVEYQLIEKLKDRDSARGSKYVQSIPGNIFIESKIWLQNHPMKHLLFVGMGCQADGYRKYIETVGLRDRVTIVDIICHGSPSPKIWEDYIKTKEKEYGFAMSFVTFKDKRMGWKSPTAIALIGHQEVSLNDYKRIFSKNNALRPSCYECPYAVINRETDITIGDFWHIEDKIPDFYNPMGNSLFLLHTEKGRELFDKISVNMDVYESNTQECWQNMLERPTPRPIQRERFWDDYANKGIEYIVNRYGKNTIQNRLKGKISGIVKDGFIFKSDKYKNKY